LINDLIRAAINEEVKENEKMKRIKNVEDAKKV
jgi:hypothetical protein